MMSNYWMPIETAPKDGTSIIVMYEICDEAFVHVAYWVDKDDKFQEGWTTYGNTYSWGYLEGLQEPMYWLPLPEIFIKGDKV